MKISKFITTASIITIFAIGYVHLHIETIKVGYSIQESRRYLSYLVDQNSKLMYNLSRLESPKNLLSSMDGEEIQFAKNRVEGTSFQTVCRIDPEVDLPKEGMIAKFFDIFTVSAEARPRN